MTYKYNNHKGACSRDPKNKSLNIWSLERLKKAFSWLLVPNRQLFSRFNFGWIGSVEICQTIQIPKKFYLIHSTPPWTVIQFVCTDLRCIHDLDLQNWQPGNKRRALATNWLWDLLMFLALEFLVFWDLRDGFKLVCADSKEIENQGASGIVTSFVVLLEV